MRRGGLAHRHQHHARPLHQRTCKKIYRLFFGAQAKGTQAYTLLFPHRSRKETFDGVRGLQAVACGCCGIISAHADEQGLCPACHADACVPVLLESSDAGTDCPFCKARNAWLIFGSRAASLTSAVISILFGSPCNDDKKLITFSDNVQDAAHRAGFFGARTFVATLRTAMAQALHACGDDIPLADFPQAFSTYWHQRLSLPAYIATFCHPDMEWMADYEYLRTDGRLPAHSSFPADVNNRLAWEILGAHTFNGGIGRTPERTGCAIAHVPVKALHEAAERFAGALRRAGIRPGQRVAVMLPNLPQTMIAFWGVVKCGAVAVMVNPLYMERELLQNLNDAGAECLVLLDMLWPRVAPLRDRLPVKTYVVTGIADALSFPLNLIYRFTKGRQKAVPIPYDDKVIAWKDFSRGAQPLSEPIADPQNTPALLQYTGGTTGIPKGVALTHSNLGTNCRQILSIIQETPETEHRFVGLLPFFHVYGLTTGLTIPAALAATVLPLPRYVPQDVLHLIGKHRPTVFPGAPAVYSSLLQQKTLGQYDLTCIKLCISGSAPLPRDTFRRFQELTGAIILEGYGLTEASPITHINPREDSKQKEGSIGMPLPGTDARIVDSESGTAPLPVGKLEELVIRGPQVMQGYWHLPDETASALRNGWLYTGDLAVMDEEGYFFIMDRKKDMVIVGGYNVYPREVDEVLLEHPDVLEGVSVGIPDGVRGEALKAYIVPRPGVELTKADIVGWCRQRLASYKVPRLVEFREELPKTIVGKVLRRALREEEMAKQAKKAARHAARQDGAATAKED